MYGTYNMGAGFALYVSERDRTAVEQLCDGHTAMIAGRVETSKERRVVIKPKNIEFAGEELRVR